MIKKYAAYVDFDRLQTDLNHLLDELSRLGPDLSTWSSGSWHPPVDIYETREEIIIHAELPGVDRNEVTVRLRQNALIITGKKSEGPPADNNAHYICLERSYGEFRRVVPLSAIVDPQTGTATLKDGMLTIRLNKMVDWRRSEYHIRIREEKPNHLLDPQESKKS